MLVLLGKTASGKTSLAKELESRGYKRIVTYTTHPMRNGELDGVDYHFISDEKFEEMKKNNLFAEYVTYNASFGKCSYGSLKEDYKTEEKSVIVLNPYGHKMVRENKIPHISIFLNLPEEELVQRLRNRGDSEAEITRRLEADREDFVKMYDIADLRINSPLKIEEIADKIECLLAKLNKMRF